MPEGAKKALKTVVGESEDRGLPGVPVHRPFQFIDAGLFYLAHSFSSNAHMIGDL